MSTKVSGAIAFSVNNVNYDIMESASYQVGGWKATGVSTLSGANGQYKEEAIPSRIAVTILDSKGNSLSDWQNMRDVTVIMHLGNGKTISGAGMYGTEAVEIDAVNATYSVVFEGAGGTGVVES